MTLQEQVRMAWQQAPAMMVDDNIVEITNLTVGILLGGGFPQCAMFVTAMAHDALGNDHPEMLKLRRRLGLEHD